MAAVELQLGGIALAVELRRAVEAAVVEQVDTLQPRLQRGFDHVVGVAHAVDVADLVAVVGRDRHLEDALACHDELNDDFRVEMEDVGVALERQGLEALHGVDAIARVELRQPAPQQAHMVPARFI
jgi:hypothetical protein